MTSRQVKITFFWYCNKRAKKPVFVRDKTDIQNILTRIHTRMGTNNQNTALIIDIRLGKDEKMGLQFVWTNN